MEARATGGSIVWAAALLIAAQLGTALSAELAPTPLALVPDGFAGDPVEQLLHTWASLEGAGSPAASIAGLAGNALAFADAASTASAPPSAILAAVEVLAGAHARTVEQVTGGAVRSDGSLAEHLRTTTAVVARIEALDDDVDWRDAMEIAALARGEPVPALPPKRAGASPLDEALDVLKSQPRPAPVQPVPEMRSFESAREAIVALVAAAGSELAPEDHEALNSFDELGPVLDDAIAHVVAAYLMMDEAATLAFPTRSADPAQDGGPDEVDWGMLMEARDRMVETVLGTPLPPPMPSLVSGEGHECISAIGVCFDLLGERSVYGSALVIIDVGGDDEYHGNARLIFDAGGDDLYENNAGGAYTVPALLVDLGGDDRYLGSAPSPDAQAAFNGGGSLSFGALFDMGGNDTYGGTTPAAGRIGLLGAINGGAERGLGLLFDGGGNDHYAGTIGRDGGINGGAVQGVGALIDLGGDDTYAGTIGGQGGINGGANTGRGLLFDGDGDDTYAGSLGLGGGVNGGATLGAGMLLDLGGSDEYWGEVATAAAADGAVNGGAMRGQGLLFDGGGDDSYDGVVVRGGINGAATIGTAVLIDAGGADSYDGTVLEFGAVNGGAFEGMGLLADWAGDDTYAGTVFGDGGVNGGSFLGAGLLYDEGGSDVYDGSVVLTGGVNGGAVAGLGTLLDQGGDNLFRGTAPSQGALQGGAASYVSRIPTNSLVPPGYVNIYIPLGVGLLVSGPGNDTYVGSGTTQGAASSYAVGILVDVGGRNSYTAGPGGLAQGAGALLGLGVLLDQGDISTFDLLAGTTGQGAGIQGVGMLLHSERVSLPLPLTPALDATYAAAPTALPSLLGGGGVGLRLDRGVARFLGQPPQLECTGSPEIADATLEVGGERVGGLRICAPDDATSTYIIDPTTGRPLTVLLLPSSGEEGTIRKPAIPCTGDCETTVEALLGPDADDWLRANHVHSTTSGGLLVVQARADAGAPAATQGKGVMGSGDDVCAASCHTLNMIS